MELIKAAIGIAIFAAATASNAEWKYHSEKDKMTGKEKSYAYVTSDNSLHLNFPYRGDNYGQLTVRQHPKHGLDVIVSVDKGQILCHSYEDCDVQVKFDQAPPIRYSAIGSADGDSKVVFLRSVPRFIAAAKKAKSIFVQIPMYQAGEQVLEFTTSAPLEWGGSAKKK